MAEETELDVLKDIRSTLKSMNASVDNIDNVSTNIYTNVNQIKGAVIDVRNKISDVKVVKLYTGKNPTGVSGDTHVEKTEKEFTELYNSGYRVIANLGSDQNWATIVMGKYPAPNTAK